MGRIASDQINQLKDRLDITEVIGAHVRLKRAGRNFVGLCPFHQEKTPSFSVNRERGFFYCFGCSAGGTAFDFLMRIEGLTFPEAVRSRLPMIAAEPFGIANPGRDHPVRARHRRSNNNCNPAVAVSPAPTIPMVACRISLGANFSTKCPEKAGPASALGYGQAIG